MRTLAPALLAAALAVPAVSEDAAAPRPPIQVTSRDHLKLPWNSTRNSWEETKEIAGEHWRAIPFAQIAAAMFLVKTGLSAPYDLVAAPFRQKTREEVSFRIQGRLVAADGSPLGGSKLVVRCTTPMEVDKRGFDTAFYESERYEATTDAEGKVALEGKGLTGASPRFMIHVDVDDGPKGAGSAGAYTVALSSTGASVTLDVKGDFRLSE